MKKYNYKLPERDLNKYIEIIRDRFYIESSKLKSIRDFLENYSLNFI